MTLSYLFDPNRQFLDTGGSPLTGGWLEVFLAYTDDRAETWSDLGGSTLNPEKIVLDSSGRAAVVCAEGVAYRLEVKDPQGQLQWTVQPCYAGSSASAQTEVTSEDGTVNVVKAASAGKNTFDLSISDALSDVNASIAAETVAREKADGSLAKSVAAETEARKSADEALSESIAAKQDKLKAGDNIKIESDTVSVTGRRRLNVKAPLYVYSKTDSAITLSCDISDVSAAVKAEAAARKSADEGLTASINAEETLRKEADEALEAKIPTMRVSYSDEGEALTEAFISLDTPNNVYVEAGKYKVSFLLMQKGESDGTVILKDGALTTSSSMRSVQTFKQVIDDEDHIIFTIEGITFKAGSSNYSTLFRFSSGSAFVMTENFDGSVGYTQWSSAYEIAFPSSGAHHYAYTIFTSENKLVKMDIIYLNSTLFIAAEA